MGLSTAALLANCGHTIYLLDTNKARLKTIAGGRSFFYEEGIDPLIDTAIKAKKLIPTDDYSVAIPESSIIFSCVGTPDNPDGSSNLTYVFSSAQEAGSLMKKGSIYVQKSTVPVGTGAKIIESFAKNDVDASYVSNPEFLREGTAISDTLWFDRIVCGSANKEALQTVFSIYKSLEDCRDTCAKIAGLKAPQNTTTGSYVATTLESAELIKVTANAFLALKISFANSIAKLSDKVGADINQVMDAVGQDKRIGRAFLNAGRGYGGGCFPKDMSGLIDAMHEHGADPQILTAAQEVNASMPGYIVNKLQNEIGDLRGKNITVLGLAFKSGTSDARKSPGVAMANIMSKTGAMVRAYDPEANNEASDDLRPAVKVYENPFDAIRDADAVLIATDWPELISLDFKKLKEVTSDDFVLVDCMNCMSKQGANDAGIKLIGVGH